MNLTIAIMVDTLSKQLNKLNRNEKLLLVEALWDSIAADPDSLEIPDHHKSILDQRLESLEADISEATSWDEFKKNYL